MDIDKIRETLLSGEFLYGETPDDISHIEYAVGAALHYIRKARQDGDEFGVAVDITIGKDSEGFFVFFPNNFTPEGEEQ